MPASEAQSNARPTGDRGGGGGGGRGFYPRRVLQHSYVEIGHEISWNIFYGHSRPSAESKNAIVSFWLRNVHKYWLPAWRTKPVQKSELR